MKFIGKIISWVMLNGATIIGLLQAILKTIKELLTGVINLLSIFMSKGKIENAVKIVRALLNLFDEWLEKIKGSLLK